MSFRERGLEVMVCYSGPVSYDFDQPDVALEGKLGVTMPDRHPGVLDAGTRIIVVIGRV